ncbi:MULTISPECIES: very short patch repair endonuclease [unclassified Kocuria]|uniref:very short patch repair endonuclease n=1 Tax=unclassified Kocuria TaxID=2649579 RepID=UPI002110B978|nr:MULTISPECIES: DNA mismatch endonuclease Vsr [unclassified Kocuria]
MHHPPPNLPKYGPVDGATRSRMSRQRRRDTKPEMELCRALRALGLGYRVDTSLPGLPRRRCDVMFKGARVAVFVDGCFWHSCPVHGTVPRNNASWWVEKLAGNITRDRDTDRHPEAIGWTVVRAWEDEDMTDTARRVHGIVLAARRWPRPGE